jgi:Phosphotransferase enzyme family
MRAPDLGCARQSAGAGVVRFRDEGKYVTMAEDHGAPLHGAGLEDRGLVLVDDTVRRPAGPWTSSVHDLLRYLRRSGFDAAPEPLGLDSTGREILTYLPGRDQGWPFLPEILTDAGAQALGRLALLLRCALIGYVCPPDARWQFRTGAPEPGESLQHGDLGPWNLLWGDSTEVAGVLDWDFAEPGDPWYDTGFLAWFTVPFMDDERAQARGFPAPPDRRARLRSFAAGAGLSSDDLIGLVHQAQAEFASRVTSRGSSETGGAWRTFLAMGMHESTLADREWSARHIR